MAGATLCSSPVGTPGARLVAAQNSRRTRSRWSRPASGCSTTPCASSPSARPDADAGGASGRVPRRPRVPEGAEVKWSVRSGEPRGREPQVAGATVHERLGRSASGHRRLITRQRASQQVQDVSDTLEANYRRRQPAEHYADAGGPASSRAVASIHPARTGRTGARRIPPRARHGRTGGRQVHAGVQGGLGPCRDDRQQHRTGSRIARAWCAPASRSRAAS